MVVECGVKDCKNSNGRMQHISISVNNVPEIDVYICSMHDELNNKEDLILKDGKKLDSRKDYELKGEYHVEDTPEVNIRLSATSKGGMKVKDFFGIKGEDD